MMRSAPSISTTGIAGEVEHVEVGQHVRLARRCQQLGALVAANLGEDVCVGLHVRWRARGGRSRSGFRASAT